MAVWLMEFGHLAHAAGVVPRQSPEMYYAYSGAEFNDQFGPAAVAKMARERHHARLVRHTHRWLRYERRHGRTYLKHANSCGNQNAVHPRGAYDDVEACGCRNIDSPRRCLARMRRASSERDRISGNRPGLMILDDPHAEMPTEEQRASVPAWHEKSIGKRP